MKKNNGNTLLEVLFALTLIGSLSYIIIETVQEKQKIKSLKVVSDNFEQQQSLLSDYVNRNRQEILKSRLPFVETIDNLSLSNHIGKEKKFNKDYSNACLIVVNNNGIKAYMYVNNEYLSNDLKIKDLSQMLANGNNRNYEIIKNQDSNNVIHDTFSLIKNNCKINSINNNSILYNLNYGDLSINFISNINTDGSKKINTTTNAVTKNEYANDTNKTITSHLYLDNVTRESYNYTTYYCDIEKFKQDYNVEITNLINQYVNQYGWRNNGNPIIDVVQNGNKCIATITGNFSKRDICNQNQVYSQAYNQCVNYHPNGDNFVDSLVYTGGGLSGNTCSSNWSGKYAHQSTIGNGQCLEYTGRVRSCTPAMRSCSENGFNRFDTTCNVGQDISLSGCGQMACGTKPTTTKCGVNNGWGEWTCLRYDTQTITTYQNYQCATINYTAEFGSGFNQLVTNSFAKPAYEDINYVARNHIYHAVNLKESGRDDVKLRTSTSNGLENVNNLSDASLNIDNANIKAGYILLKSQKTEIEQSCDQRNLGKMVQQADNGNSSSQLICSYDKDYCPNSTGYCYLPLKSQSELVYGNSVSELYCPSGTIVDTSYNLLNPDNHALSVYNCNGTINYNYEKQNDKIMGVQLFCKNNSNNTKLAALLNIKCIGSGQQKSYINCKTINNEIKCSN